MKARKALIVIASTIFAMPVCTVPLCLLLDARENTSTRQRAEVNKALAIGMYVGLGSAALTPVAILMLVVGLGFKTRSNDEEERTIGRAYKRPGT